MPLSKTALAALFAVGIILNPSKFVREGEGRITRRVSYVNVGPVDRKRAFLLSNNHRHLSVNGIFLHTKDKLSERPFQKGTYILTLYAAVKSCDALKSKSGASDMRLNIDAAMWWPWP